MIILCAVILCAQAGIRTDLSSLYEVFGNSSSPAINFIRSRVGRMSERWVQAGLRMGKSSNTTVSPQMRVRSGKGTLPSINIIYVPILKFFCEVSV